MWLSHARGETDLLAGLHAIAKVFMAGTVVSLVAACLNKNSSSSQAPDSSVIEQTSTVTTVTGVRPVVGKPGDVMTLSGNNLNSAVVTSIESGAASARVSVVSPESGTFIFPEGLGLGLKEVKVMAASAQVGAFSLVANLAGNFLPIIISDAALVCSDVTYINAAGGQSTGTRACSGGSGGSVDPYSIRKGQTVSGVAGKLIPNCQNRVNRDIFDMSGGTSLGVARVKKITSDRIFTLGKIGNAPLPMIANSTVIKPVGSGHRLPISDYFNINTSVLDGNPPAISTTFVPYVDDATSLWEVALMAPNGGGLTVVLSNAACDETDSIATNDADCFDIVIANNNRDVWDTIDDLNGPSSLAIPDSSPYEAFPASLCGYIDGGSLPAGAVVSWKDNTIDNAGVASSCFATSSNCALKDLTTGLTWFKGHGNLTAENWYEAVYYCSTLALNSRSWRLPTQKELMAAYVDTIRNTVGTGAVQNYNTGWWSSTSDSTNPTKGWHVNLATGATASGLKSLSANKSMCVRDAD